MAKKGKGKKKKEKAPKILVSKSFYVVQITELNRKLAHLRTVNFELVDKNLKLEEQYLKLEEDRNDIITYLKRTLQEKLDELAEILEQIAILEAASEAENEKHQQIMAEMQADYDLMVEQLTSEIKLIIGKINALEEYRVQKDELMAKFEIQETVIEEQEIRHKKILYEIEKKFILEKDALKKEMEKRLLKLKTDFEESNDLRIAGTAQRAIRQNITLNKKMGAFISTNEKLENEHIKLKHKNKSLTLGSELYKSEFCQAESNAKLHHSSVEHLNKEIKRLKEKLSKTKTFIVIEKQNEEKLHESLKREENLLNKVKILKQNIHATRCQDVVLKNEIENTKMHLLNFMSLILECIKAIQSVMNIEEEPDMEESLKISKRENLLNNLLSLLIQTKDEILKKKSLETIPSAAGIYERGDLGFVPKVHSEKSVPLMMIHMDSQVGKSVENIPKTDVEIVPEFIPIEEEEEEKLSEESESSQYSLTPKGSIPGESDESTQEAFSALSSKSLDVIKSTQFLVEKIADEKAGEGSEESDSKMLIKLRQKSLAALKSKAELKVKKMSVIQMTYLDEIAEEELQEEVIDE